MKSAICLCLFVIFFGTFGYGADEKEPKRIAISELSPDFDGADVVMSFTVAETNWLSGSVPKGQPRSFGITPVVAESDPRFSVLVSGELAEVMERFGYAPPQPGDPAVRRTVGTHELGHPA